MRSVLKKSERLLAAVLPPLVFCAVQDAVRPVLDRRLSHSGRRVRRNGQMLEVSWPTGKSVVIPHHRRYPRYMRPDGLEHVLRLMEEKYQDGEVRIEPGDVVFEVGANVGEFTLAASRLAGRVFSVEPDPRAWECLARNVAGAKNVTIDQKAVGAADGVATLHVSPASADSTLLQQSGKGVEVEVWTLPTWMAQRGVKEIDFLKLEAEGFEPEILQGAGEALRSVRKIAVDCGPERYGQPTFEQCEALLAPWFRTWRRGWLLFGVRTGVAA